MFEVLGHRVRLRTRRLIGRLRGNVEQRAGLRQVALEFGLLGPVVVKRISHAAGFVIGDPSETQWSSAGPR